MPSQLKFASAGPVLVYYSTVQHYCSSMTVCTGYFVLWNSSFLNVLCSDLWSHLLCLYRLISDQFCRDKGPTLCSSSMHLLETLFLTISYLFTANMKFTADYRSPWLLVLIHTHMNKYRSVWYLVILMTYILNLLYVKPSLFPTIITRQMQHIVGRAFASCYSNHNN